MERFLNDRVELHCGDCLDVLGELAENSIDACVTDPPYHLTSIVKRFGGENFAPAQFGTDGRYARASAGFMGKLWDGGDIAFQPETWREVYRVLKPGAHLLAFGGTRTYDMLVGAVRGAGFEVRDTIGWLFGQGFPKNHAVADGWGTALKPAMELICLARKPLSEKTVAANVLRWGTGAINVDGCRVESDGGHKRSFQPTNNERSVYGKQTGFQPSNADGRWPANVIHDGSEEVVAAFPETNSGALRAEVQRGSFGQNGIYGKAERDGDGRAYDSDSGSAARFYYSSKADADDRLGSRHPTVKPLDLMQYLVRLITPPRGLALDPFAGTGTTGEAAWREGMRALLIEREAEYQADIRRRMELALAGPDERMRESVKAKNLPIDYGPLFAPRDEYNAEDDFAKSIDDCYRAVKERKAAGGKGWPE